MRHKSLLNKLADQYETVDFLQGDPAWFMHQVVGKRNQETMAFIASCLSYGARKAFLPRIQHLLDCSHAEPYEWILKGKYRLDIPDDDRCYYRLYTNSMMIDLFQTLQKMYQEYGDMENYIRKYDETSNQTESKSAFTAIEALCHYFNQHDVKGIIPKNTLSCCKRVCMFLRWMVRTDSPVDLGIWGELIDKRSLIMPLDTHVIQQAMRLKLLTSKSATMASAQKLTSRLREVFPDDPLKADFALFGYGINH